MTEKVANLKEPPARLPSFVRSRGTSRRRFVTESRRQKIERTRFMYEEKKKRKKKTRVCVSLERMFTARLLLTTTHYYHARALLYYAVSSAPLGLFLLFHVLLCARVTLSISLERVAKDLALSKAPQGPTPTFYVVKERTRHIHCYFPELDNL